MTRKTCHLLVEKGPEQGLEIVIPADGARVGRSSNNDIVLKDPAMSRFHCRFFFKPGEGLWAEDLGSANQTLLNDQPLFEARIHPNDRLVIGDTTIKVVSEEAPLAGTTPAPTPPPPAAPAPPPPAALPVDQPAAQPAEEDAHKIASATTVPIGNLFEDVPGAKSSAALQFLRPPPGQPNRRRRIALLLAALLAVGAAAGVAFLASRSSGPPPAGPSAPVAAIADETLEIAYEKVQANSKNIFRYQMLLKDNRLSIQIDDLQNQRHVPGNQMKELDAGLAQSLADSIRHTGFYDLKEEYKGLASGVWDIWDLSITIGRKTRRVRVMNSLEPEAFKNTREAIELFGQNELGLAALALPPEKLLELARQAALLGRSLYDQRNVKNENLAMAIRTLKEAEIYLETIEPKPDFYADAVALRGNSERELQETYDHLLFLAERAIKLRDWSEAAVQYRLICEKIPDRSDERHAAARKKLIDVERHLKKK